MVSFQRLPSGHGGRRRGVRAPRTSARPEGAPEIRVIQRGYLWGPQERNYLLCPGGWRSPGEVLLDTTVAAYSRTTLASPSYCRLLRKHEYYGCKTVSNIRK